MMQRRLPNARASVATAGRGVDKFTPPCSGRWDVYDVLVDYTNGPLYHDARREARDICSGCPIQRQCLTANRDEGWVKSLVGTPSLDRRQKAHTIREWAAKHGIDCPETGPLPKHVIAGWEANDPDVARTTAPQLTETRVIRQWARDNGIDCGTYGKIPTWLRVAYEARVGSAA